MWDRYWLWNMCNMQRSHKNNVITNKHSSARILQTKVTTMEAVFLRIFIIKWNEQFFSHHLIADSFFSFKIDFFLYIFVIIFFACVFFQSSLNFYILSFSLFPTNQPPLISKYSLHYLDSSKVISFHSFFIHDFLWCLLLSQVSFFSFLYMNFFY